MRKTIIISLTIVLIGSLVAFILYLSMINAPFNSREANFTIAKGEWVNQISRNLYEQKIIKSMFFFETYVWLEKKEADFLAGDYKLEPGLNIKEVAGILTSGRTVNRERKIKIIEGWKITDINRYLVKEGVIADDSFLKLAETARKSWPAFFKDMPILGDVPPLANFEGFLFPDTYRIFKDATAEDIISKMLGNFNDKLTPAMLDDIKTQGRTLFEIITLASIIEKEVKKPEDMKIVGGIFTNRLRNGQALESCATLAYILGVNKEQYSKEDTEIESPYNTYKHRGLPPGPIANPGLTAIAAAVYPADTEYNYFLSRSDNGETVYAKTYEEHLRNKSKYLK